MRPISFLAALLTAAILVSTTPVHGMEEKNVQANPSMDLGEFSISLAVKDLQASRSFYEKLGFAPIQHAEPEGSPSGYGTKWMILRNGKATIGLFQGMFDKNALTFNPADVRGIQHALDTQGLSFVLRADEKTTGPAAAMLLDPDGNPVLLDQH